MVLDQSLKARSTQAATLLASDEILILSDVKCPRAVVRKYDPEIFDGFCWVDVLAGRCFVQAKLALKRKFTKKERLKRNNS